MTEIQPKRGGKREPLPRLTITIPNYGKHQEPLKKGRRTWVSFDRTTPNDLRLRRVTLEARYVFLALVMISDEGIVSDITIRELSKAIDCRPQTVETAIKRLSDEGLIRTKLKRNANANDAPHDEIDTKNIETQTQPSTPAFEQSANHAGFSAPQTDRQTDITNNNLVGKPGIDPKPAAPAPANADADASPLSGLFPTDDKAAIEAAVKAARDAAAAKAAKTAEKMDLASRWAAKALGTDLADALFADLQQQALGNAEPDEWLVRQISGLRKRASSAPNETIRYAVTEALNRGKRLIYAHAIIDNQAKAALSKPAPAVGAKAEPETYIDDNGVERYPSGIQKYDLTPYTAGW